ncbi:hypothetical protein SeLEV6574_g07401, partial [Synchytrium endobioticum]
MTLKTNPPASPPKPYSIPYHRQAAPTKAPLPTNASANTEYIAPSYTPRVHDYANSYNDYSVHDRGIPSSSASTSASSSQPRYMPTATTTSPSNDYVHAPYTSKRNIDTYDHGSWFAHTSPSNSSHASDALVLNSSDPLPLPRQSAFSIGRSLPLSASPSKSDLKSHQSNDSFQDLNRVIKNDPITFQRLEAQVLALKEVLLKSMDSSATLTEDRVKRIEDSLERLESTTSLITHVASTIRNPDPPTASGTDTDNQRPTTLRDIETMIVELTDSMEMRTSRIAEMVHELSNKTESKPVPLQSSEDAASTRTSLEELKQHISRTVDAVTKKDPVQVHAMSSLRSDISQLQSSVEKLTTEVKSIDETIDIVASAQQRLANLFEDKIPKPSESPSRKDQTEIKEKVESARLTLVDLKSVCEGTKSDVTALRDRMDEVIKKKETPISSPTRMSNNSAFAERLALITAKVEDMREAQEFLVKRVEQVTKSVLHDMLLTRPRSNNEDTLIVSKSVNEIKSSVSDMETKLSLMSREQQIHRDVVQGNIDRVGENIRRLQLVMGELAKSEEHTTAAIGDGRNSLDASLKQVKETIESDVASKLDALLDGIEVMKQRDDSSNTHKNIEMLSSLVERIYDTIASHLPVDVTHQLTCIQNAITQLSSNSSNQNLTVTSCRSVMGQDIGATILTLIEDQSRRERETAASLDSIQHTLARLLEWVDRAQKPSSNSSSPSRRTASVPPISSELFQWHKTLVETNSLMELERRRADILLDISELQTKKFNLVEDVARLQSQIGEARVVGCVIENETPPQSFAPSDSGSPSRVVSPRREQILFPESGEANHINNLGKRFARSSSTQSPAREM